MTSVWGLPLSCTDKIVLLALADNANDEGRCFPSVQTLATKCSLTDRGIQKVFQRLESMLLMTREERSGRSTIYTVTPERYSPPNAIHPEHSSPTPEHGSPPPPNASAQTPEHGSPIILRNHQIEPSKKRQQFSSDDQFDEIRKTYPRRGGGQNWEDARRGYRKLLSSGYTHKEILAGVQRYAAHIRAKGDEGSEFVKMASSFFGRNKCFLEEFPIPSIRKELSAVEKVKLANEAQNERVVRTQSSQGFEDLDLLGSNVRQSSSTGLRRIGS